MFRCEDEQAHIVVHPNILQPLGLIELEEGKTRYYATDNFEGFTLQNMLSEFGKLEEPLVKQLIRQLMLGVHFLHCHRLAHNRLNL